jgi:hypothetical protein
MSIMRIIIRVASNTSRRRHRNMRGLLVASFTFHFPVRAFKRELRHSVMVKARYFPITAIVAFGAVGSVASLVAVIFLMTPITGAWWLLDAITRTVAGRAGRARMLAEQGKAGVLIMVE